MYTDGEEKLEENKDQQARSTGIDLYSIVRDVLREWWTIGLLAVSVYLMVNMWTEMSYKPEYTTTAVFSVTARGMNQTLYEQLSSAQSVAAKFKTVLESDLFDRKMEEILGEKIEGTKTVRQIEFNNRFHTTFLKYLNFLRISEVKRMLEETDKSLIIIAQECGFASVQTMTRNFISEYSMTPAAYRKQQKI